MGGLQRLQLTSKKSRLYLELKSLHTLSKLDFGKDCSKLEKFVGGRNV